MKPIAICAAIFCLALSACTKKKTDYQAEIAKVVPEYIEFKEATSIESGAYRISIEALNGKFYKGYNELRIKVSDKQSKQEVKVSAVTFLPIITKADGTKASGPHRYQPNYLASEHYFSGYAVFTDESGANGEWDLYLSFDVASTSYRVQKRVQVEKQANKNLNMVSFKAKDGADYIIALVSPQKPKVAENALVAGIYRYNPPLGAPSGEFPDPGQFSYAEVGGYTLQLDPRMPEPSMGNHSSLNNKDLVQKDDGFYHGVVNYTMTGNWTLNLIMLNQQGQILKGTVVPTDFTPGVEGKKSELYIDILF